MKKLLGILFALVLVLSFSLVTAVPAAAVGPEPATLYVEARTPPAITIDGTLSLGEWDDYFWFTDNSEGPGTGYDDDPLPIFTGYLAFDADNLYLAFDVEDNTPNTDRDFLYVTIDTPPAGEFNDPIDALYWGSTPTNPSFFGEAYITADAFPWDRSQRASTWGADGGAVTARTITGTNRYYELKIPLAAIGAEIGDSIGLKIQARGGQYTSTTDPQVVNYYPDMPDGITPIRSDTRVEVEGNFAPYQLLPYQTIQSAIDAANPGDTINVAGGTYDGNLIVYKEGLTIRSTDGAAQTTVDASKVDKSTYINAWGNSINYSWAEANDPGLLRNGFDIWSDKVTIDGFTIINATFPDQYNRGIGILVGSIHTTYAGFIPWNLDEWRGIVPNPDEPTPTGVTLMNNIIEGPSDGIYNWASSGNTIEYNEIRNTKPLGGTGIQVYEGGTNNIIRYNTIKNAVDAISICGAWPDLLLDVSNTQVVGNAITNSTVGIKFYNIAGADVIAQENDLQDNDTGIKVESVGDATVASAQFNNLVGNTMGVQNNAALGIFDATNNWWGTKDGAVIAAMVSDNVDYDPWFGAEAGDSKSEETKAGDDTVDAKDEADSEVVKSGAGTPTITVTEYEDNPGDGTPGGFSSVGKYIDVHVDDTADVDEIEIRNYYTPGDILGLTEKSLRLSWWDGTSWIKCSDSGATYPAGGPTYRGYVWAKIRSDTNPTLADLAGTPFMPMGVPPGPVFTAPIANTSEASDITATGATLNGNLISLGSASTVDVSFEWGVSSGVYPNETAPQAITSTGAFSASLSSLSPNTTYYFRAKADGGAHGICFGNERSFTTEIPPVTLESISAEPSEVSLDVVGETEQLTVTATYSDDSTDDVTAEASYESSDTSVAAVSDTGLITAVAEGSATITVSYAEETDTVSVMVVSVFDPMDYDADGDGVLSKTEAIVAVWDYFDGFITKEDALEVLWLYFG